MPRADQSSACAWRGRPVRSCVSTRMGEERDAATDAPPAPDGGEEVAAAGPQSTAATDGDDEVYLAADGGSIATGLCCAHPHQSGLPRLPQPEDTLFGYLGRKADGLLEKLGNLGEDLSSSTSSAVGASDLRRASWMGAATAQSHACDACALGFLRRDDGARGSKGAGRGGQAPGARRERRDSFRSGSRGRRRRGVQGQLRGGQGGRRRQRGDDAGSGGVAGGANVGKGAPRGEHRSGSYSGADIAIAGA